METIQVRDVELDQCPSCRWVWLDHMEIDELFSFPKIPERLISQQVHGETPDMVPVGERYCPRCRETLTTVNVDGVELDVCAQCKGLFTDLGEIRRLAEAAEKRYESDQEELA